MRRRLAGATEALLRRLERDRAVAVTEYPFDPRSMWGWDGNGPNPWLAKLLDEVVGGLQPLADEICALIDWCSTIPPTAEPGQLAWDNRGWASIDALMQVHALRSRRPATYLEVGSGYSTMFARKAIEDFGLDTRIVSVDPQPRAEIDALCDVVLREPFQTVYEQALAELEAGDVFLFDGSHLALMGSDATVLFCGGLELVPPGVLMGIDDIILPYDYHPSWARRFYGEQYLVAAWLLGGHAGWEVVLPAWHATEPDGALDLFGPLWPVIESWGGQRGTSFWVESVSQS